MLLPHFNSIEHTSKEGTSFDAPASVGLGKLQEELQHLLRYVHLPVAIQPWSWPQVQGGGFGAGGHQVRRGRGRQSFHLRSMQEVNAMPQQQQNRIQEESAN